MEKIRDLQKHIGSIREYCQKRMSYYRLNFKGQDHINDILLDLEYVVKKLS